MQGVGQVSRVGGVNREINVTLDPVRMSSLRRDRGGRQQRAAALSSATMAAAAPKWAAPKPRSARSARPLTVDELRNLTIPLRSGAYVRLVDVADVGDGSGEVRSFARLNGRPVAGFNVVKVDTASEVDVERGVLAAHRQAREGQCRA